MKKQTFANLDDPRFFINRELSWLQFNERVLREGQDKRLPAAERLKFLSIVSSNLDEFFMVRVAGLQQQRAAGMRKREPSGLTPAQQLYSISGKVHSMMEEQSQTVQAVFEELKADHFAVLRFPEWSPKQREYLSQYFDNQIYPVLTPMAVEALEACPVLQGLQLFVALLLRERGKTEDKIVLIPVPGLFPRFVNVPTVGRVCVAPLEDIIVDNAVSLFAGHEGVAHAVFRITRDADVDIQDDEAGDLLNSIETVVRARRIRAAVRLEISARPHGRIKQWLKQMLAIKPEDIYEIDGLLDTKALMQLTTMPPIHELKAKDWPAQPPQDLVDSDDLWQTVREKDILLSHPYERFDPVVQMVEEAARDTNVLAIKQTLYRTSGDSPIVRALGRAAANGKEVTVLVELKARFDEANNVNWAKQLEEAGCHVIYGIVGLKTHAKALLIVRNETSQIRRYVHLSTGNYNDRTAKLYSDIGLMSCEKALCADVAHFFNLLTGVSESVGWQVLTIAPTDLRRRFLDLIEREIQVSTPDQPGLIMAKMNSLQDKQLCQALYRASQAGVRIRLNVRGICCLRPGMKGLSETLTVTSIVDRYLEHARIYYFNNAGHEEVYLASADWMSRNLDRRLEMLFPIRDARLQRRLIDMLELYLADNTKAWQLNADGRYERVRTEGKEIHAQRQLYEMAVSAVQMSQAPRQFRPLKQPKTP